MLTKRGRLPTPTAPEAVATTIGYKTPTGIARTLKMSLELRRNLARGTEARSSTVPANPSPTARPCIIDGATSRTFACPKSLTNLAWLRQNLTRTRTDPNPTGY